ncbi:arrestin domain-containing protein 2 isoform X2 [Lingula anatina]|uniref:Arrestin domain-containing protein 2 isoform X2 n=1 Tax=Lingula anatina TaxID=7574 RepID=A0A1S3GZM2_LINAN|nr:arrestin domain-containing protein 2 isoform X2 [Lingula anatina]|eukprot:XP_013378681.1 arrestin domain-containing protein 2 isoform X2 [Lingula anatina]
MADGYEFTITFKGSEALFHAGDKIQGYVTLKLTDMLAIKGIELVLYGYGKIFWKQQSAAKGDNSQTNYEASETYLAEHLWLWGDSPSGFAVPEVLSAGTHDFPFSYELPSDLPCSFTSQHGRISYSASAILWMPNNMKLKTTAPLLILKDLDLSMEPFVLDGIKDAKDVSWETACFTCRLMKCCAKTDRNGFVPGEVIRVWVQVDNLTSTRVYVRGLSVELKQTIAVVTRHQEGRRQKVKRLHSFAWKSVFLRIPPLPPSRLDGCRFLNIKYEITVKFNVHGKTMQLTLPVLIGTLPHRNTEIYKTGILAYEEGFHMPEGREEHEVKLCECENGDVDEIHPGYRLLPRYRIYRHMRTTSNDTLIYSLESSPQPFRKHESWVEYEKCTNRESLV